jgi:hypothetical protein
MKRLIVGMVVGLALAACASAPTPEQPAKADWAPCGGSKFNEGTRSYARCIKYVAMPAEGQSTSGSLQRQSRFGEEQHQTRRS